MESNERTEIKLVLKNEQELYSDLDPEDDFRESVKMYIRSKAAAADNNNIRLTVISKEPLDEDKFRSAVSNWTRDEKTLFKKTEKDTLKMLIGLLVFGSVMIVVSLALVNRFDLLKYSLLPILGSLALSRAVRIMIIEMPVIRAQRWMINEMEKNNMISFKYDTEPERN